MSENTQEIQGALESGQVVTGTVTAVDEKSVTVHLGNGLEGFIAASELSVLRVTHAVDFVQIGDEIQAVVETVNEKDGVVTLSKRKADAIGAWERLQAAFDSGESIDVVIRDVVKGGLVTDVGIRGFIPASLVEAGFVQDLNVFKGQTLQVKVAEIDRENNRLILSRKALLDADRQHENEKRIADIHPGSVLEGTVLRIADFGAFVDLGGVDGLVHVSEMSWDRVAHPQDAVKVGDLVQVKVLKVDPSVGKISLSMKAAQENPWSAYATDLKVGSTVTGTVKRVVDFGAFVELKPGLEGLVHVSQISNEHVANAADALKVGETVSVRILSVEPDKGRISLSMRDSSQEKQQHAQPKAKGKRNDNKAAQQYMASQPDGGGTGATLGDLFGDLFKKQ